MVKLFKPITKLFGKLTSSIIPARAVIKGWDLYGRVPYDDFIFTTSNLINKNILRRSMTEALLEEVPIAYAHYSRRRIISDIIMIITGVSAMALGFLLFGWFAKVSLEAGLKQMKKENPTPISAIRKDGRRKGRKIEGMGEGWYDMEFYEDEEPTNSTLNNKNKDINKEKKDDDDEDEDEDTDDLFN